MNDFFPPSASFNTFISSQTNRCAFITSWFQDLGIKVRTIKLAGKTHIIVKFATSSYNHHFKSKTLIAHYDRVETSPGANDNSAACFMLMDLARKLVQKKINTLFHNITIIFTDGEEAAGIQGIKAQGAFALGEGLRRLGIIDSDVYVFDACGRGSTLVISTSGMNQKMEQQLQSRLVSLHNRASLLAAKTAPNSWICLPTPFSDNAGLLVNGIASQVITMLPHQEANLLLKNIESLSPTVSAQTVSFSKEFLNKYQIYIPETWQDMHTEKDTPEKLTKEAFHIISRFLEKLAKQKVPQS